MDGSNWSITADINEILRENGFLTSLFRLHRSVWQLYIIYQFGQKVICGRHVFITLSKSSW